MNIQQAPENQRNGQHQIVVAAGEALLTVPEAARQLQVSVSTVWRWINRGELPAYRVGRRRIVLKVGDLQQTLTVARPRQAEEVSAVVSSSQPAPLSPADVVRLQAAMERARVLRARILQARGGEPLPDSTELLREQRDQRSAQL